MGADNLPRRKVVSSYKSNGSINMFECTLICGHREVAYGIKPKGGFMQVAPASVGCFQCRAEKNKEANNG